MLNFFQSNLPTKSVSLPPPFYMDPETFSEKIMSVLSLCCRVVTEFVKFLLALHKTNMVKAASAVDAIDMTRFLLTPILKIV